MTTVANVFAPEPQKEKTQQWLNLNRRVKVRKYRQ